MANLVVITGASSGLGLALAQTVPFPARLIDISRSGPPEGTGIEHLPADLADPSDWRRVGHELHRLVNEEAPNRAVLIHAAGTIEPIGFAGEVDDDAYTGNVLLNAGAGQLIGNAFLKALDGRSGDFGLVMITSGAAHSVYPGWSAYGAGKAALDHWVRNVGAEQRTRGGVRVVAIAPGVLDTVMQNTIRETSKTNFPHVERFRELHEDDELTAPEEAARKLWSVLDDEGLESGDVIDLRDYAPKTNRKPPLHQ